MRFISYENKCIIARKVFGKSKFFLGERVNYDYDKRNYWDDIESKSLAAIYDASYVRYKTIELLAKEIKDHGIKGEVAELGVYKGQTSYALNYLFPEKKLFMFDTFEGFDERQVEADISKGYSTKYYDLRDTSSEEVMNNMPNRDKCVIKKGFFPDTAEGIEDTFCFVSLDVDMYLAIYDGIEWFYPRLSEGGYLVIHDYNNLMLKGVKQAVRDYENKNGYLKKVPVPDLCGSLVVVK